MKNRWTVGIDIAKDKFDVCIKFGDDDGLLTIKGSRCFENNEFGFEHLWDWVLKRTKEKSSLCFVMEATGIYYENLAYFLYEKQVKVSVELPNKVKNYFKSHNIKTKTDKVDAGLLATMGFERTLKEWQPMSSIYKELRDVS